ncbi:MAG: hypothetical protein R2688_10580 [Fimbriimonadaceae bacterium]
MDGRPMLKATVSLKQEDGDSVIKIALVGDGRNVYSIFDSQETMTRKECRD